VHYKWHLDDLEFREAVEEADRLDPGWRLADLEAARAVVPDEENSALQVMAASRLMPKNWFPPPKESDEYLENVLGEIPPQQCLNEEQSQELAEELEKVSAAVLAARRLSEMPGGRYKLVWSNDAIFTLLPHLEEVGQIRRLLWFDTVHFIQQGNIDGALTSCRAILNVGRSIGDEPAVISQVTRFYCQWLALQSLERALAQGQPSEASLARFQRLLQDESEQPLLLIAARGEGAIWHQFLKVRESGELDRAGESWHKNRRSPELEEMLDKKKAHSHHGACLKYLTEYVEIRKLPFVEQLDRRQLCTMPPPQDCSTFFEGSTFFLEGSIWELFTLGYGHKLALMRSALTALAVERYRLTNQRWPDRLDGLVPGYLSRIPTDPFDGQPLRYKRLDDGVVIYSVGADRKDDGGRLERIKIKEPDTDVGFQLWNPERRSQPPQ
jgi:hypothetical protein